MKTTNQIFIICLIFISIQSHLSRKKINLKSELDNKRYVFLSANFLSKQYKTIPQEIIDNAIFISEFSELPDQYPV